MNVAFALIGFRGIEDHHVSTISDVISSFGSQFSVEKRAAWPPLMARAPLGWAPYSCVLLRRC
jgi:hypothetical protein